MEQVLCRKDRVLHYMEPGNGGMAHTVNEYLRAIKENAPASTNDVAEAVGVTRQGADYRLKRLEEDGIVTSVRIGNSLAWSVVEEADNGE